MRQQNRLCRLRVRLTRHDCLWMLFSLAGDSFYQVRNLQRDITDGITHPHAEQGCHLVIAGTPRTQTTAYFRTNDVNETALHGAVHVFITGCWAKFARSYLGAEFVEAVQHGLQVGIGKQSCTVQYLGVCL